ncbi:MAG: GNAT family N-acetyltransferase [Deltaproteobacteria bacterium]|nr:GNAT family N-acetyltransferase [Deltaproteobacteria bacterium]
MSQEGGRDAPHRVVAIGKEEAELIGDIIADGFHDDPVCTWFLNGTSGIKPFFTMLTRDTYLPRGFGQRTADGTGVTLWIPPGESTSIGRWTTLKSVVLAARHGGVAALQRGPAIDQQLGPRKPKGAYYYLFAIAVRRQHQGEGIGHELMVPTMRRIDEEGASAYIESSNAKNLSFYRRFGFEVTDEVQLAPDGPSMWTLWREGLAV